MGRTRGRPRGQGGDGVPARGPGAQDAVLRLLLSRAVGERQGQIVGHVGVVPRKSRHSMDSGPESAPDQAPSRDAIPVWRDVRNSVTTPRSRRARAQGRQTRQDSLGLGQRIPATMVDFASAESTVLVLRCGRLCGALDRPAPAGQGPCEALRGLVLVST